MAAKPNPDKRVAKTSAKTTRRKAGVKSLTRRAPAKAAKAAKAAQPGGSAGTTIERTVTIGRRPAELFDYWRDFSNCLAQGHIAPHEINRCNLSRFVSGETIFFNQITPGEVINVINVTLALQDERRRKWTNLQPSLASNTIVAKQAGAANLA